MFWRETAGCFYRIFLLSSSVCLSLPHTPFSLCPCPPLFLSLSLGYCGWNLGLGHASQVLYHCVTEHILALFSCIHTHTHSLLMKYFISSNFLSYLMVYFLNLSTLLFCMFFQFYDLLFYITIMGSHFLCFTFFFAILRWKELFLVSYLFLIIKAGVDTNRTSDLLKLNLILLMCLVLHSNFGLICRYNNFTLARWWFRKAFSCDFVYPSLRS